MGKIAKSQWVAVQIESTQTVSFSGQSDSRLVIVRGSQRHSKISLLKGGHKAQVNSDQMVLVMARWEAGPHKQWPKVIRGELETPLGSQGTELKTEGIWCCS